MKVSYVVQTIRSAYELGYKNLSISGGEPLLYPHLKEILLAAKELGMPASLITNGSFSKSRYNDLKGLIYTIGVSIDGEQTLHNSIRKNEKSFDRVNGFLDFARDLFPSVGVSFTLTDQSWDQLPALLEYAESKSVDIFQIYPLEKNGRARTSECSLSNETLMRAYLIFRIFNSNSTIDIHFNCLSKATLDSMALSSKYSGQGMAETIDLVVLNELGELLPYTYGMNPAFKIADKNQPLRRDVWEAYKKNQFQLLSNLQETTYQFCVKESGYLLLYHQILRNISFEL